MEIIHSVFTIGRYCSADFLLADMYIRGYSSPFSWMFVDLETALHLIQTSFEGFTDAVRPNDGSFIHKEFPMDQDRICQWIHHDLSNETTIAAIKRRADRLISRISLSDTLLIYYDNTPRPIEYYTDLLEPFLAKYGCKVLVVIHSSTTKIVYQVDSLCIIESDGINARPLLNYLYMFNIVPIEESCVLEEPLIVRKVL